MVLIDKSIQKDFFKYNVVVINEYAKILHKCQLDYFANERLINHWIYKLGGISEEFCKILLYWKNMGKMPLVAEKILVELEEALNEKRS